VGCGSIGPPHDPALPPVHPRSRHLPAASGGPEGGSGRGDGSLAAAGSHVPSGSQRVATRNGGDAGRECRSGFAERPGGACRVRSGAPPLDVRTRFRQSARSLANARPHPGGRTWNADSSYRCLAEGAALGQDPACGRDWATSLRCGAAAREVRRLSRRDRSRRHALLDLRDPDDGPSPLLGAASGRARRGPKRTAG
jgi:hypothetical protein